MASFSCSISMIDAYQRPIRKEIEIEAADHAAAKTIAGAFMTDFAAATEARILYYIVGERVTYTDVVTAGANRDEGMTVTVLTQDNERANIKVPCPINAMFNEDGSLDQANSTWTALFANYLSGDVRVNDGEIATETIKGSLDSK